MLLKKQAKKTKERQQNLCIKIIKTHNISNIKTNVFDFVYFLKCCSVKTKMLSPAII